MRFEWDPRKAKANLRRHGVSFDDAKLAFDDPSAKLWPDTEHSHWEERYCLLGRHPEHDLLLLICHCYPDDDVARIISARKAGKSEWKKYLEE